MRLFTRTARPGQEDGVAMITVMLVIMVVTILAIGSVSYATGNLNLSRNDQDWNAALSAAEAGIDDYLLRLNEDASYWKYNKTNAPPDGNNAFKAFVPVPGPVNGGQFRYEANSTTITTDGAVKLRSSGRVGKADRTLYVTLRRRNFLDYLYFTEYETTDPELYRGRPSFTVEEARVYCKRHAYDDPPRSGYCADISFYGGTDRTDVIKGPLHSNDAIRVYGTPDFRGETSSSWPSPPADPAKRWIDRSVELGGGPSNPKFAMSTATAKDPRYAPAIEIPPSNSELQAETDPVIGGSGCLYTGPTKILLNSAGTMTVTSPYTKSTNTGCGGPAPNPKTVPIPPNGVVYVQGLPTSSTDPNYRSGGCSGYPLSFPVSGDVTPYKCTEGDVLLSGTMKGQLTIAAENNIVVTGDVKYQGGTSGQDLLGLIANNYVEVYNPINSSGANISFPAATPRPKQIDAAILSVLHSFRVQNYNRGGSLGTLKVNGTIAQLFRGAVGTFGSGSVQTGYDKDYNYDKRLKYMAPPRFLDPTKSAWQVKVWTEEKPQY